MSRRWEMRCASSCRRPEVGLHFVRGNHADHLAAYLAILISGFVWVPLNPANGRPLNSRIATKAKPDARARRSRVHRPGARRRISCGSWRHCERSLVRSEPTARSSLTTSRQLRFTGGTSGEPKGVIQTHGNMLAVIENMQAFYQFKRSDCNLAVAPLTHGSSHYVFPVLAPAVAIVFYRITRRLQFSPRCETTRLLRSCHPR